MLVVGRVSGFEIGLIAIMISKDFRLNIFGKLNLLVRDIDRTSEVGEDFESVLIEVVSIYSRR